MKLASRRPRLLGLAAAAVTLGLSLSACGSAAQEAAASGEVTLVAPDKALTATTASYTSVPLEMGYFKEAGANVTVQPVDSALSAVQSVATGKAFITYASFQAALSAYGKDDNLAVIGLTNGNIFRVMVPEDSPIKTAKDLKGTTIGSPTLAGVTTMYAKGVLSEAGLDGEKDAKYLPAGYGAQAADAFKKNEIQAYSGFDGPNLVIGDLMGTKIRDIPSGLNDLTGTSALIVRKDSIKENPKLVEGVARAFFKAMVFSETNPEAAIKMHWKRFPQAKPAGGETEKALAQAVKTLETRLEITGGRAPGGKYGVQADADLQKTADAYKRLGMLKEAVNVKDSGILDLSLADAYNDFDEAAVKKQAEDWKG